MDSDLDLMENENENENENESVKAEDVAEAGTAQQKNHGFATHSSGTWNQDELISSVSVVIGWLVVNVPVVAVVGW